MGIHSGILWQGWPEYSLWAKFCCSATSPATTLIVNKQLPIVTTDPSRQCPTLLTADRDCWSGFHFILIRCSPWASVKLPTQPVGGQGLVLSAICSIIRQIIFLNLQCKRKLFQENKMDMSVPQSLLNSYSSSYCQARQSEGKRRHTTAPQTGDN